MKSIKMYYIVDGVAETISAAFTAVNDEMAKRQFTAFIDKLPEVVKECDYSLLRGDCFSCLETFEEIKGLFRTSSFICDGSEFVRENKQQLLDFEGR